MLILWLAVVCGFFWIADQNPANQQVKFKGFETRHINKRFAFVEVSSKNDARWLEANGRIKNISSSDLEVEYISFYLFNKASELILMNNYYFPEEKSDPMQSGESRSFELSLSEPNCLSATKFKQFECANIEDSSDFDISYFTADIHWTKELPPDHAFRVLKAPLATSLVSNVKIEPLDQSYNFNKTAKLTYVMNDKTKTVFGNFGNMAEYGIAPDHKDVNNDGIDELILVDGGNGSRGMNYVIMRLKGETLEPLNVLTRTYDEYGDNAMEEFNDSGLRSLEIGDFSNDGLNDLKSCVSLSKKCKTYYWNEHEEIHLRKVMKGEN